MIASNLASNGPLHPIFEAFLYFDDFLVAGFTFLASYHITRVQLRALDARLAASESSRRAPSHMRCSKTGTCFIFLSIFHISTGKVMRRQKGGPQKIRKLGPITLLDFEQKVTKLRFDFLSEELKISRT